MSRALKRFSGRLRTVGEVLAHFARSQSYVLVPLVLVLLLAGLLLVLTGGLAYVAPFVYALF
jgi:hypothetical protein